MGQPEFKNKRYKDFTPEDLAQYNHERYLRNREKRLEYQHKYYREHAEEQRKKANLKYRRKCGLL